MGVCYMRLFLRLCQILQCVLTKIARFHTAVGGLIAQQANTNKVMQSLNPK